MLHILYNKDGAVDIFNSYKMIDLVSSSIFPFHILVSFPRKVRAGAFGWINDVLRTVPLYQHHALAMYVYEKLS
jgi:hypothetical protein